MFLIMYLKDGIRTWYSYIMPKGQKIGFRHSKKSKLKISRNNARYWLGKKRGSPSKKTREKQSLKLKGISRSERIRQKIIAGMPTGKKHWNWKGGRTSLRERIWHRIEYTTWRNKIFERDNYKCIVCKKRSGVLNADHYPMRFSDILNKFKIKTIQQARKCKKLWDIKNGRTLCLSCHRKTPTWGGRK